VLYYCILVVYCCTLAVIIIIVIIAVIIVIISLLFDYRGRVLEDSAKLEHENVVVNEARQQCLGIYADG